MANYAECKKAGIDPKIVEKIERGLSKYGRMADKLGIGLFGGSGTGSLRIHDRKGLAERPLILGYFDGYVDGGDGTCWEDEEGLMRGE